MARYLRHVQHFAVVFLLLLGFGLSLFQLDRFGIWDGEVHNINLGARPLSESAATMRHVAPYSNQAPLWFVVTHIGLEGHAGLWLLRFPSAWVSMLALAWLPLLLATVGLLYLLWRKHFLQAVLFLLVLGLPILAIAIARPPRFHAKYVAYCAPPLAILIAAGCAAVVTLVGRISKLGRAKPLVAAALIALLLAPVVFSNLRVDLAYYCGDARAFAETTEPILWRYRGPCPELMARIGAGDSGSSLARQSPRDYARTGSVRRCEHRCSSRRQRRRACGPRIGGAPYAPMSGG
ncbi:MAG: hypothetical protein ACUVX9_02030 [Anaerolineae bacterium]